MIEERRLRAVPWSFLAVDEAQRLKNANCRARSIIDGLRYESLALLTGTPVQNCPTELFSLLNLLAPRVFADADAFDAKYGSGAKPAEGGGGLQRAIAPYMKRRLKKDVLSDEMPPKEETLVPIELTREQKKLYRALLEKNVSALAGAGLGGRASSDGGSTSLNNVFIQLRKLCNHPQLLHKADRAMPSLDDRVAVRRSLDSLVEASGKLQLLHKLLPRLRDEGRKVLIFSQMNRMLDLLEDYLALAALPYAHATRHTPHATRHTLHATRHTAHATRHTAHATCHMETRHVPRSTCPCAGTSASTARRSRRRARRPSTASRRATPRRPSPSSSPPERAASAST